MLPTNYSTPQGYFQGTSQTFSAYQPNDNIPTTPINLASPFVQSNQNLSGINLTQNSLSSPCDTPNLAPPKKRGRKSTVPVELRESTRRFKKRNLERKRRAFISEKMNSIQALTMKMLGECPEKFQKMEKADILTLCQTVMKSINSVMHENPLLSERLKAEIRSITSETIESKANCESEESDFEDEGIENKENVPPLSCNKKMSCSNSSSSGYDSSGMSLENVWRPYL